MTIRLECPFEIFEGERVAIVLPAEWTLREYRRYLKRVETAANAGLSIYQTHLIGALSLCKSVENDPGLPLCDWPLDTVNWITDMVYGLLQQATNPKKKYIRNRRIMRSGLARMRRLRWS